MTATFTLYRFFDAEDALLYVGLTVNPGRRMEKHRATQNWWNDVARIEMEQHPDLATLRAAEREAIEHEKPRHNIRMNGTRAAREEFLTWVCEVCSGEIADGDGYLTVSAADIGEYMREVGMARERRWHYVGPLVRWHVLHGSCDPYPDATDYWVGCEHLRTHATVIRLSAHLFGKGWLQCTAWDAVLREVGSRNPSP